MYCQQKKKHLIQLQTK